MRYTAMLTGNRRDIRTDKPKVLLTNIDPTEHFERGHCWVEANQALSDKQPHGHAKPIKIEFEADIVAYERRGDSTQDHTLTNIRNIKRIK